MNDIVRKTALITGASRGLGAAAARAFAIEGGRVVLLGRSKEKIEALASEIAATGGHAIAIPCDVSDYAAVASAIEYTIKTFGRIDVLLNNAGVIEPISHVASPDPAAWARSIGINLIGAYNVVRATDAGAIAITTRRMDSENGIDTIQFSIKDTGVGISEAARDRIFAPFEQETRDHKHVGGTGLGLPIARDIARLMGGDIDFDSIEGMGSEFRLTLPMKIADPSSLAEIETPLNSNVASAPLNILVAEDTPANQMVIKAMLEKRGHAVAIAENGEEAVELFTARSPDIVFMDIQMPIMNGFEATRTIRKMGGIAGTVPIVALTAQTFEQDRTLAIEAGMTAFLSKPIAPASLDEILIRFGRSPAPPDVAPDARPECRSDAILQIVDDLGPEMAIVLLRKAEENARELISTLDRACKSGNSEGIRRSAHSLCGLLRQIGLVALGDLMRQYESSPALLGPNEMALLAERYERALSELDGLILAATKEPALTSLPKLDGKSN